MNPQKMIHNLETGEITYVEMTDEETALLLAEKAQATEELENRPPLPPNSDALYARIKVLEDAITELYELAGGV